MNEEERADWLARAIDDLLNQDRQRPTEPPPPELDREELNALLRIASARAEAAQSVMHKGIQYEGEVWQRVLQRLDRRRTPRTVRPFDATEAVTEANEDAASHDLQEMEVDELRQIARLRRQLAEQAVSIAEAHRAEVWKRVQSRLGVDTKKNWWSQFFRRADDRERLAAALDRAATSEDNRDGGDEGIDNRAGVSSRTYWSRFTRAAENDQDRLRNGGAISTRERGQRATLGSGGLWPRLAVAGALGALVLVALGPIPATGFADHPVAGFLWSVAEHIGFREIDQPPSVTPVDSATLATDMTAAEAAQRLGVPAVMPADSPAGFALTSSRFFETPLTAEASGTFALTYTAADGSALVIYQERASGADFAVEGGSATDVALGDGTAATYVEGMWQPTADGGLAWSAGGAQTLVFERNGVRATIQYTGPEADAPSLFALADSMATGE